MQAADSRELGAMFLARSNDHPPHQRDLGKQEKLPSAPAPNSVLGIENPANECSRL